MWPDNYEPRCVIIKSGVILDYEPGCEICTYALTKQALKESILRSVMRIDRWTDSRDVFKEREVLRVKLRAMDLLIAFGGNA